MRRDKNDKGNIKLKNLKKKLKYLLDAKRMRKIPKQKINKQ